MLVSGKQEKAIFEQAKREGWAIGAFNCMDIQTAEAVLQAAEELGVPVCIQTWDNFDPEAPEGDSSMSQFDADNLNAMIFLRAQRSPVPVIIHLDHTPTYGGCIRGIQSGASSVMIDASQKPYDENVAITRKVVEAGHACGVLVEGEIGHVGGHANSAGAMYTEVEDAVNYVRDTGVDLCAVSFGTVHGFYTSEPVLNYERIRELRDALPVPLVMHGSSGLREDQYRDAIANGVTKINFGTYIQLTGGAAMKEFADNADANPRMGNFVKCGIQAAKEYLIRHMQIFGTRPVQL